LGLGRSPSRQTIWLISEPKRAALVATIFVDFLNSKNNFLHNNKQGAFDTIKLYGVTCKKYTNTFRLKTLGITNSGQGTKSALTATTLLCAF